MKIVTIRKAMQAVVDAPVMQSDEMLQVPAHELVCRTLFEISNTVDFSKRVSQTRANQARHMIFTRLVGRRRTGSHPATLTTDHVDLLDLTGEELEAKP